MMKSTIKHLSMSLISCFFLLIGCQERSNDDSDKFCTEYSGRPDVAITYPEMVAMLQQYDKTKKEVLAKAIWRIPSPFFSMNLAMGLCGCVASNNSILLGPERKNEVFTPSLATSSIL